MANDRQQVQNNTDLLFPRQGYLYRKMVLIKKEMRQVDEVSSWQNGKLTKPHVKGSIF